MREAMRRSEVVGEEIRGGWLFLASTDGSVMGRTMGRQRRGERHRLVHINEMGAA
jgi:hypothetical protein